MDISSIKSRRFLSDDPSFVEIYNAGANILSALIDRAQKQFKDGKSLNLAWCDENDFKAYAYRKDRDSGDEYFIVFSKYIPYIIYEGASNFIDTLIGKFCSGEYKEISEQLVDHENGCMLPNGWSRYECRDTFFERALVWLFHHELGHIYQGHEVIRKKNAPKGVDITLFVDEVMSKSKALAASSTLSWVYHATELAADHQALHYSVFYEKPTQVIASAKHVSKGWLWCLTCAVAYMFHCFYGEKPPLKIPSVARWSHPDPTLRLAMLTEHLCELLNWESVRRDAPDAPTRSEVEQIVISAEVSVGAFWSLTHGTRQVALPNVLKRLMIPKNQLNTYQYMKSMASIWARLHVDVNGLYFGENRAHVMNLTAPVGGMPVIARRKLRQRNNR